MHILGTFAYCGSGQDTLAREIAIKYSIRVYSIGDIVRTLAKRNHLRPTREHLQRLRRQCDNRFGRLYFPTILARELSMRGENAIVTGLRTREEAVYLRKHLGMFLLNVKADESVRYKRLLSRGDDRDPRDFREFLVQSSNERQLFDLKYLETVHDAEFEFNIPLNTFAQNVGDILSNLKFLKRFART
jgi:cytidylate kinase